MKEEKYRISKNTQKENLLVELIHPKKFLKKNQLIIELIKQNFMVENQKKMSIQSFSKMQIVF